MPSLAGNVLADAGHGGGGGRGGQTQTPAQIATRAGKVFIMKEDASLILIYQYLVAAFVGLFFLRNIVVSTLRVYARRRRNNAVAVEKGAHGCGAAAYAQAPLLLKVSDRLDDFFLKPVSLPLVPVSYTRLRFLLSFFIFTVNVIFTFSDGTFTVQKKYGYDTAGAFALRTGWLAVANYPVLFLLAGRSNIVGLFTGVSYIELRRYHIEFGIYAFVHSLMHTIAYSAHYYITSTGATALAKEASKLYFQLGCAAFTCIALNCLFGIKFVRSRAYEFFLAMHILGAAIVLGGSYYHRPQMRVWSYAGAGIWVFERVCRWGMHLAHIAHSRLFVRLPAHKGRLSVVDGAIKLNVPFKGKWEAGQHFYVSFWGTELLRTPWLYGQVHPFSVVNVSNDSAKNTQELRFLMRVHGGLTKTMAAHIEKRLAVTGSDELDCLVTLEGPYGSAEPAEDFDSVLLVAGGSGITHPMSTFHELAQRIAAGKGVTSAVKLIWAMHHADQANWVVETLTEARTLTEQAKVHTSVDFHITRSGSSSDLSTPSSDAETPSDCEKKSSFFDSDEIDFAGGRATRFYGRPDVQVEVTKVIAESQGRTLVVVCGPSSIADDVRRACAPYPRSQVVAEYATFEC